MTVFATVIVHGPEYAVRLVPGGTPVLSGPGKHPPSPSEPPGVLAGAMHLLVGVEVDVATVDVAGATVVVEGLPVEVDGFVVAVWVARVGVLEIDGLLEAADWNFLPCGVGVGLGGLPVLDDVAFSAGAAPYVRAALAIVPPTARSAIETRVTRILFSVMAASGEV